jgi:bifunctional isochorismate lyase / aryl carrier protein
VNLTKESIKDNVATLLHLHPTELGDDDNLFEWGLDSIRVLSLLEQWREGGAELSFVQLAEQPTLTHWYTLLTQRVTNAA